VPGLTYAKPERVWLKSDPDHDERWLQDRIGEDPSLLGLGDLILKDRERAQPHAGRLDLLMQEPVTGKRYEVEIQLGKTDEAHIIRTVEYWDIERKRYPQYEHAAVLVAEDFTSRFLNVIGLFNGLIPLVAIQLNAVKLGGNISLVFTRVLDEMPLGLVDEDEDIRAVTDRAYWEKQSSKQTMALVDELNECLREIDPKLALKYTKFYIGLARDGRSDNFVSFTPRKDWLWLSIRLPRDDETQSQLDSVGLEVSYDARYGSYRLRIDKTELARSKDVVKQLMRQASGDGE